MSATSKSSAAAAPALYSTNGLGGSAGAKVNPPKGTLTHEQMNDVFEVLKSGRSARDHINQIRPDLKGIKVRELIAGNNDGETEHLRIEYVKCHEIGLKFRRDLDLVRYQKMSNDALETHFKAKFGSPNSFQTAEYQAAEEDQQSIRTVNQPRNTPRTWWEQMRGCPTDKKWLKAEAAKHFPQQKYTQLTYGQYEFVRKIIDADEFDVKEILPGHVLAACADKEGKVDIRNLFTEDQRENFRVWLGSSGKAEVVTMYGELMYRYKDHGFMRLFNETYCYESLEKAEPDEASFLNMQLGLGFDPRDINSPLKKEVFPEDSLEHAREIFKAAKGPLATHNGFDYVISVETSRVIYRPTGDKDLKNIKQILLLDENNERIHDRNVLENAFTALANLPNESSTVRTNAGFRPLKSVALLNKTAKQIYDDLNRAGYIKHEVGQYHYFIVGDRFIFRENRNPQAPVKQITFLDSTAVQRRHQFADLQDEFVNPECSFTVENARLQLHNANPKDSTLHKNFNKFGFDPRDMQSVKLHFANAVKAEKTFEFVGDKMCLFVEGGRVLFAPTAKLTAIKRGDLSSIKMHTITLNDGSCPEKDELRKYFNLLQRPGAQAEIGTNHMFEMNLHTGKVEAWGGTKDVSIENIYDDKYLRTNKAKTKRKTRN